MSKEDKISQILKSYYNKEISEKETKKLLEEVFFTNIGCLRQWLNEDRITDVSKMVTNKELIHFLR